MLVLTYTIKPNIYGGIASRLFRIPYIANITGLGTSIENGGFIQKIVLNLYKIGLSKASCVFFQNSSNCKSFTDNHIVSDNIMIIPGSGVNLKQYFFEEYPSNDTVIKFLFIGRIMKNKGIEELLYAASILYEKYPNVQFDVLGNIKDDYSDLIRDLASKGIIKYHGYQDDVHSFIKNSHATVLPSYHEGTANVLLESASTGRPVLATNVPGCKETFDEGVSGFGFEARNTDDLVNKLIKFVQLPYEQKKAMGLAGRKKMEKEYDRNIVIDAYISEIENICGKPLEESTQCHCIKK